MSFTAGEVSAWESGDISVEVLDRSVMAVAVFHQVPDTAGVPAEPDWEDGSAWVMEEGAGGNLMPLAIDEKTCTGCGTCVEGCPVEAISIVNNTAVIDQNSCKECLLCMDECPSCAIYQILDQEVSVRQSEESVPNPVTFDVPRPRPSFNPELRKQQTAGTVAVIVSGLAKLAGDYFKENSFLSRRKEGRGKLRAHKRRHRGW